MIRGRGAAFYAALFYFFGWLPRLCGQVEHNLNRGDILINFEIKILSFGLFYFAYQKIRNKIFLWLLLQ
jgi:hypothetical protein